jgi:hypothetical protein
MAHAKTSVGYALFKGTIFLFGGTGVGLYGATALCQFLRYFGN